MPTQNDLDERTRALLARVLVGLFAVVVVVILAALIFQRRLGLTDVQTTQIAGVVTVVAGVVVVVIRFYFHRRR